MGKEMKKGQIKAMENKNSEKPSIATTIQEDETKISIGHEEEESVNINKERYGNDEKNVLKSESPSPSGKDSPNIIKQEPLATNTNNSTTDNPSITETNTDSSPSLLKNDQEDEELIKSTKAEMGEVREENERLKKLLSGLLNDYQSLQTHFFDILRQKEANDNNKDIKPLNKDSSPTTAHDDHDNHVDQKNGVHQDDQLVSLSLGRMSSTSPTHHEEPKKNERKRTSSKDDNEEGFKTNSGELSLGLGTGSSSEIMKKSSCDNSFEDQKEEPTEMWPPSKALKTARSEGDDNNDGVSQISPLKKTRVSVRARCDTPTMNDGCQWRKYGQKIAKGNPCPRAYYRCTVSPTCPVRKQVQRCVDDMSILITTYEGTHNHPLPISATAMASTTSAAASMLQSRSTTSSSNNLLPGGLNSNFLTSPSTTTSTSLFQSSNIRQPQQFYFPNSTTISTSTSHPTVTLDLTVTNPSSSSSHLGPRYSSTCLSFSSSSSSSSSVLPWNITNSYNNNGYLSNYGIMSHQSKTNPIIGSHGLVINSDGNYNKQAFQEASNNNNLYQSYMNNIVKQNISSTIASTHNNHQQSMTETIAAATKAITSNPKFQSALAAALTSIVGKGENAV